MADDRKKCAHERCVCTATTDSDYCSAYCEASGGTIVSMKSRPSNAIADIKAARNAHPILVLTRTQRGVEGNDLL
jgi:hypothetical protein